MIFDFGIAGTLAYLFTVSRNRKRLFFMHNTVHGDNQAIEFIDWLVDWLTD